MKRFFITAASLLFCAALLGACNETRSVTTPGLVLDLSGRPVADAEVRADAPVRGDAVRSDGQGRFVLEVKRDYSAIPLPGSGVFLDPVHVRAQTPSARAHGAALALSVSDEADGEAILILVPSSAIDGAEACPATDEAGRYALALSERLDPAAGWLQALKRDGLTQSLYERLRGDLFRLSRACEIPAADSDAALDRLQTALDAYADD